MPKKGIGWPAVGQTSHDVEEHSRFIVHEARQLLEFGAPTDDSGLGKQCPYFVLNAFCTSVLAYLESSARPLTEGKENVEPEAMEGKPSENISKTRTAKKPQLESPFSSKVFRQISQPLTPHQKHRESQMIQSGERAQPLNTDTFGVLVLYVPSNFDVVNQKRAINGITSVNKGFIPGISIKSIEWLIPEWAKTKHYSNLLVEFFQPQHANAAIREQLLVGTKVLGCEYYERDSRLRQCFFCQQYKHLEPQCQATSPRCGRCAAVHVTSNCKVREDPQNFHCAICGGGHRAWDNVCRVRQEELDRVRIARANAPSYHAVNGQMPEDCEVGIDDTPSREFAGTRRYSVDYLVEVNLRGGRKSHGRNRGKGGQHLESPAALNEDIASPVPETPSLLRAKAEHSEQIMTSSPQASRTPFEANPFDTWIRSRLVTLGIEPYTPRAPKPECDGQDAEGTPATPTPNGSVRDVWDRFTEIDTPSKIPDRTRKSFGSAMSQREKSPMSKAANITKIRNSDSWR